MRTLTLLLTALACGFAGYASAADMPVQRKAPPLYAPAADSWAGFYLGVDAGYTFDAPIKFATDFTDVTRINPRGGTFGAHAGHNWQTGPFVYGLELFAAWNGRSSTVEVDRDATLSAKVDYFGSARAKLGLALGDFLFYGTGGIGLAHTTARVTETPVVVLPALELLAVAPRTSEAFSVSYGPVVGAGVEWRLFGSSSWLLRADWQHYMLGHNTFSFAGGLQTNVAASQNIDVITAGLSYKF